MQPELAKRIPPASHWYQRVMTPGIHSRAKEESARSPKLRAYLELWKLRGTVRFLKLKRMVLAYILF